MLDGATLVRGAGKIHRRALREQLAAERVSESLRERPVSRAASKRREELMVSAGSASAQRRPPRDNVLGIRRALEWLWVLLRVWELRSHLESQMQRWISVLLGRQDGERSGPLCPLANPSQSLAHPCFLWRNS